MSAGGLEVATKFLEAMRPDSGMAFVIVQHLEPTRKSLLAQLLGKHTKLPVVDVKDGMSVQALLRDGYRVFGTSRKPTPDTADGIAMLICDVTNDASVQSVVDDVLSRTGRIDLLVNNAGLGLVGGAEESSVAQVQALFDVNVRVAAKA